MDVKLLGIIAGFVMILAATVLALRQKTLSWQHVIIFCLGGVLAGISSVQLQASKDSITVGIGEQLAQATSNVSEATSRQADALASLDKRLNQLQSAVEALQTARVAGAGQPQPPVILPTTQQKSEFSGLLNQSRASNQAALRDSLEVRKALSTLPFRH